MDDTAPTYAERRLAELTTGAQNGQLIRAHRKLPTRYLPRDPARRANYFHKLADAALQRSLLNPESATTALTMAIKHAHSLVAPAAELTYPPGATLAQCSAADQDALGARLISSREYQERQKGHEARAAVLAVSGLQEQVADLQRIVAMLVQNNGQASPAH